MGLQEINDKINAWVNSAIDWLKRLPQTIKNLPKDEKIAWSSNVLGVVLVITAVLVW